MIIGDPSRFAIESHLDQAYERREFRGLGRFLIHVGGRCYGVNEPKAIVLARPFSEIETRTEERGTHTAPFSEADLEATIASVRESERPWLFDMAFGISKFDRSHVYQFDVTDKVWVVAFRYLDEVHEIDPDSVRDVWLDAAEYYQLLETWRDVFDTEWLAAPEKVPLRRVKSGVQ